MAAVELHLNLEKLKCVIIASPGFVRDEFLAFLMKLGLDHIFCLFFKIFLGFLGIFVLFFRDFEKMMVQLWRQPTEEHKKFTAHREKFISVHSSSGYKHSLQEVLLDEEVARRLADTKARVSKINFYIYGNFKDFVNFFLF